MSLPTGRRSQRQHFLRKQEIFAACSLEVQIKVLQWGITYLRHIKNVTWICAQSQLNKSFLIVESHPLWWTPTSFMFIPLFSPCSKKENKNAGSLWTAFDLQERLYYSNKHFATNYQPIVNYITVIVNTILNKKNQKEALSWLALKSKLQVAANSFWSFPKPLMKYSW